MKKFRFPLQKLRDWRQIRFETEEAQLALLVERHRVVSRERGRIAVEEVTVVSSYVSRGTLRAEDVFDLENYRRFARNEIDRLTGEERALAARIAAQRARLIDAKRDVMALDGLKDRLHATWHRQADKEQEEMVAELVVARWKTVAAK